MEAKVKFNPRNFPLSRPPRCGTDPYPQVALRDTSGPSLSIMRASGRGRLFSGEEAHGSPRTDEGDLRLGVHSLFVLMGHLMTCGDCLSYRLQRRDQRLHCKYFLVLCLRNTLANSFMFPLPLPLPRGEGKHWEWQDFPSPTRRTRRASAGAAGAVALRVDGGGWSLPRPDPERGGAPYLIRGGDGRLDFVSNF